MDNPFENDQLIIEIPGITYRTSMESKAKPQELEAVVDISKLVLKYDVNTVLEAVYPIMLMYGTDELFLEGDQKVDMYVKLFHKLFSYPSTIFKKLFEIHKILPQSSINGSGIVLRMLNGKGSVPKLLMKTALNPVKSDPLSYEYYVGLTLNTLRLKNIRNFAVLYGRVVHNEKSNLFYEYIRDKEENTITLNKYITEYLPMEKEVGQINIVNILLMLLISLQCAQDELRFTHYDLHTNNILLVKLNDMYEFDFKWRGKEYKLFTQYVPYIIDFGRSHIDPNKAIKYESSFKDVERRVSFSSFQEYQSHLYDKGLPNRKTRALSYELNPEMEENISLHIKQMMTNPWVARMFSETPGLTISKLKARYYTRDGVNMEVLRPDKFHSKTDFYKLTRAVCLLVISVCKESNMYPFNIWGVINTNLESAFPYFLPGYLDLVAEYPSFTGLFNTIDELINYTYENLSNLEPIRMQYDTVRTLSWDQIAGGREKKEISTMDDLFTTAPANTRMQLDQSGITSENQMWSITPVKEERLSAELGVGMQVVGRVNNYRAFCRDAFEYLDKKYKPASTDIRSTVNSRPVIHQSLQFFT